MKPSHNARRLRIAAALFFFAVFALTPLTAIAQTAPAPTETHFSLWSRTPGNATLSPSDTSGAYQITVAKTGDAADWSFAGDAQTSVQPNTLLTLGAWIKCNDALPARLDVIERDAGGNVLNWQYAPATVSGTQDWKYVATRFVPQPGTATVQARLEGDGAGTYWIRGMSLTARPLPSPGDFAVKSFTLSNSALDVQVNVAKNWLRVTDRRSGKIWVQAVRSGDMWSNWGYTTSTMIMLNATRLDRYTVRLALLNASDTHKYNLEIRLNAIEPKLSETLSQPVDEREATLTAPIAYPPPFLPHNDDALVVPNNEGLLYPAADQSVVPYDMPLYGGHAGLSMPWYGVTAQDAVGAGIMTVVNTPDDATLSLVRRRGSGAPDPIYVLTEQPVWEAQKGKFGYARSLVYIFLPRGGYVAQAKAYRAIARARGLLVTLAAKRKANPNVDKLVGAVDVWDWDSPADSLQMAKNLKAAGGARILWSQAEPPDTIRAMNALGFLTGEYDIYQDAYAPDAPAWDPKTDHWPQDLVEDASGKPVVSWVDHQTKPDGAKVDYTADACCSIPGLTRAEHKIPDDLKTHPYEARFIDTITASPWRECYNPLHPTTRTQDKLAKMATLKYVSATEHLVTGSETGIDCAVPYEDYFEGMESLARYRQPNSGYNLTQETPPIPDFLKYQVGTKYRVPLFELVYHDCMVTTWYWGDSTNVEHDYWTTRDLLNILYGTSPLFILDKSRWQTQSARFAQTLATVCPALRKVAYAEMLSHRFVTPDGSVQESRWSNGVVIRVDFGKGMVSVSGD